MSKVADQKKYGITTVVNYASKEDGMSFNPARLEFISNFDKIIQDMQNVTAEVLRIINHPNFV